MILRLIRYSKSDLTTLGLLYEQRNHGDMNFLGYTLEDRWRPKGVKVAGETCIPEGVYNIDYKMENTPMTIKYQDRFPWFRKHLEIQKVPNFENVYLHIGNNKDDTEGCVLIGDTANNNSKVHGYISHSTQAFKRFYELVTAHLDGNHATNVALIIEDGQHR